MGFDPFREQRSQDAGFRTLDAPLGSERLSFNQPWVDLLGVPLAFLFALLVSATNFGRSLLFIVQIQFHELGHASTAWLSSRAALPLPFGFTFWREDRSSFVGLCVLFLLSVFGYRAWAEHKRVALGLSAGFALLWLFLSCVVSPARSMMWIIAGGIAGEFWISAAIVAGFFFPLPDRLRWDFVRFFALVPALCVWLSSTRLWLGVSRGTELMPRGTLLGIGDTNGDLDRLIADYAWSEAGLTKLYLSFAVVSGLVWLSVYGFFALRALHRLRTERSH